MPDTVIDRIKQNYRDYTVVQIGRTSDVETPFEKALDLSVWDTAELISKAAIYIGVNSGFYHVANAYPKVRKKLVLDLGDEKLDDFQPKKFSRGLEWYDYNVEYFNTHYRDIGATTSFCNI
jgi:hypothetical protein